MSIGGFLLLLIFGRWFFGRGWISNLFLALMLGSLFL